MASHTVMDERTKAALKIAYQQGVGGAEDVDMDFGDEAANEDEAWYQTPAPEDETTTVTALRYTCKAGAGVLYALDSVGEWFAAFFGITTPRYQYVLDDLITRQREAMEDSEAYEQQAREAAEERAEQERAAEEQPVQESDV